MLIRFYRAICSVNGYDFSVISFSRIMQSSAEKGGIRIEYARTKMGEVRGCL